MSKLNERIRIEFANLERILDEFPATDALPGLTGLEIAGTAALLHGLYSGIENLLKQVIQARGQAIPAGDSWHRDLIVLASAEKVISETTASQLRQYLAFRHFFSHAYAVDLKPERLQPLVEAARGVYRQLRRDIESALPEAQGGG
jgi:hypothetical protein